MAILFNTLSLEFIYVVCKIIAYATLTRLNMALIGEVVDAFVKGQMKQSLFRLLLPQFFDLTLSVTT